MAERSLENSLPAGIGRITESILEEARQTAEEMERKAREEAEELLTRVSREMEQWEAQAERSLELELEELRDRERSRRETERNRMVLETRQSILGEMFRKTKRKLEESDPDACFSAMKRLFACYAHKGDGIMCLSARDVRRMPEAFAEEIRTIAGEKGGSIALREDPAVEDGFLLIYGETEENCTLQAMFEAQRDALLDKAGRILWERENANADG